MTKKTAVPEETPVAAIPVTKKMSVKDLRDAHDAAIVAEDRAKKHLHELRFKAANDGIQQFDRSERPAEATWMAGADRDLDAEIEEAKKVLEEAIAEVNRLEALLKYNTKDIWGTVF
jgi:hypothetical protein